MMDTKDYQINIKIMQEIGIDISADKRLVDQDTGDVLQFKDKFLVGPNVKEKNSIEFDPINNVRQMTTMFDYFTRKLEDDDSNNISVFYPKEDPNNKEKTYLELKTEDNKIITSGSYINESLTYVDVIMRLNGSEDVDLSEYDAKSHKELEDKKKEKKNIFKNRTA